MYAMGTPLESWAAAGLVHRFVARSFASLARGVIVYGLSVNPQISHTFVLRHFNGRS